MAVNLEGLHPDLRTRVDKVLAAMAALGFPMRVCQGVRTVPEQQALFAQGRTAPGEIVTNCDGVKNKSRHQLASDGFGHAVDCCFTTGKPFGETQPWRAYGECGTALGLYWGGFFKSLPADRPHLELT